MVDGVRCRAVEAGKVWNKLLLVMVPHCDRELVNIVSGYATGMQNTCVQYDEIFPFSRVQHQMSGGHFGLQGNLLQAPYLGISVGPQVILLGTSQFQGVKFLQEK